MKTLLYNATIIPMNADMEIVKGGYILTEGNTIREMGNGEVVLPKADEYYDVKGQWIMPGFINTHTHVPMVLLRGYADDLPLHTWLNDHIFPAEAKYMHIENIKKAALYGMVEMIKSGTTCFNDMYFFEEIIAGEAKKTGMRARLSDSLIDFPTVSFQDVPAGLKRIERLIKEWSGDDLIHPAVCTHSPYTCSQETLLKAKKLADKYDTLLHIHLSETRQEVQDVRKKIGLSPVRYLDKLGILDQRTIAAHGVWFDESEINILADAGASIAHCPKSNLKLASGIADIYTYQNAGINISIGTDGAASNNILDMVEEMRFAALLPKVVHYNPEAVDARTVLRMATINAAHALGLGDITGSLEVGKRADLICIQPGKNMEPVFDEYSAIVYAMNSHNINASMINGEWVMKDRQLIKVNEEEITLEKLPDNTKKI
ncbi:amidohydrolase [Odoribacter sp. OttesenSCG-928-A06]|nr:amidohydrolase [Odoribacter sp. OttesenSCG-928-A06]